MKHTKASKAAAKYDKQYAYTSLSDCDVGSSNTYNFYGVIVDASFPHKSYKSDRFVCSLKLTDPSMIINKEGIVETCTLVMFAKRFEDLPISQRIGDIIRVHRASCGTYKGNKQFTANVFFNSSWALFSPLTIKNYGRDGLDLGFVESVEEMKIAK